MDIAVAEQTDGRVPVTIFHIRGDVDTKSSEQLQMRAREAVVNGTRNLLLDLSEVRFVSSAGLRTFHIIFKLLTEESDESMSKGVREGTFRASHLKLVNPSPSVEEVLHTSGFDMFLEVHHDLQKAIASF